MNQLSNMNPLILKSILKKISFFFFLLFSLNQLYSQSIKDTLLFHKNPDNTTQVVFIDAPQSSHHQKVIESLISDSIALAERLNTMESTGLITDRKFKTKFSGEWISIFNYKDDLYAYCPSEPYYNLYLKITDSTVILNDFNDGLVPYAIKEINKQNSTYVLKVLSASKEEKTIYIFLMNKNQIAIKSSLFIKSNIWLVTKSKYFEMPIIVNECKENRCGEFQFK